MHKLEILLSALERIINSNESSDLIVSEFKSLIPKLREEIDRILPCKDPCHDKTSISNKVYDVCPSCKEAV